jgi:mannan endo-1,4-beta-mannosidase
MRRRILRVAVNVVGFAAVASVAVAAGMHFEHKSGAIPSPFHNASPPPPLTYLGVYEPSSPHPYTGVERFSELVGRSPNIALYYGSWWEPFQLSFARAAEAHHAIPMVQIEPRNVALSTIASGQYDAYLRAFARSVRSFKRPVIMSFGHEMNADWYGWGYRHTSPKVFISAWRHIYRLFARQRADNVRWLWTVNVVGGPDVSPIQQWWPGPAYVTWVGVDGHYFTPSIDFASLFGATLGQARQLTGDPVLISEAGIAAFVSTTRIADLFLGAQAHHLLGVVWFDVAGHNLRIEGNPAAIAQFKLALGAYIPHRSKRDQTPVSNLRALPA